jgi:hypothetical protein
MNISKEELNEKMKVLNEKRRDAFLEQVKLADKMKVLLSNNDFSKYIENSDKRVVKFCDLEHFKDAYELLPKWEDFRIILIEQKINSGHWVCITRRNNNFCFFDPYGNSPYQNLNFISKKMNELLGQDKTDFSQLFSKLKKNSYNLEYNKKKFQKLDTNINTCGRHIIVFIGKFILGYSLEQYQKWLESEKKRTSYSFDEIVSILT